MSMELEFESLKRQQPTQGNDPQTCEWPDCKEDGSHRAPKSRDELNSYRWFCTIHAREYNRSWNYYEGMSDEQVEADVRQDTVWRRPTWRIGAIDPIQPNLSGNYDHILDPFEILKNVNLGANSQQPKETNFSPELRRALEIFEIDHPSDLDSIKHRFKELVKRYHPDAKGAMAGSDEKMKDINEAYKILMDFVCR